MPMRIIPKKDFNKTIKYGSRSIQTNQYFIAHLFNKITKGYSPLVLICGKQRIGKSFIGVYLCHLFMHLVGKQYEPEKHTFYDPMKAIEMIGDEELVAMHIDEAGSILTRREWYKKTHIALDKIVQTQAYKTILYVFISPFASDIDRTFQKHFDYLLRVDDRGKYKAFRILKKYDEFQQEKTTRRVFLDDVYLNMSNIPKETWNKYLEYSIKKKEEMRLETLEQHENDNKQSEINHFKQLKKELF